MCSSAAWQEEIEQTEAQQERGLVTIKILLCIAVGHRWVTAGDGEIYPVLRCTRCGGTQSLATGTQGPEGWAERVGRANRLNNLQDAQGQPPP